VTLSAAGRGQGARKAGLHLTVAKGVDEQKTFAMILPGSTFMVSAGRLCQTSPGDVQG